VPAAQTIARSGTPLIYHANLSTDTTIHKATCMIDKEIFSPSRYTAYEPYP